jgi:hypothetical protein
VNSNDHLGGEAQIAEFNRTPQTGVVTLLFTDIVSSTALKQHLGDKAGAALIQEQRALAAGGGRDYRQPTMPGLSMGISSRPIFSCRVAADVRRLSLKRES